MASSNKKVLLRTVDAAVHPGYLPLTGILSPGDSVELLGLSGRVESFVFEQVRSIAYVRDFNLSDRHDPERLTRRTFLARPRSEGLWLRLSLLGSEPLEGLAALDLSLIDALLQDRGIFLTPPDIRSNTQRIFIPRHTITSLQVLAVVTTPSKPKSIPADGNQPTLFE